MQTFYYNGTTAYINEPTPDTLPDEFAELGITKIYVQEDNFNTFKNSEIYADYKDILVPWNFNIFKVTSTDWDPENNTNALYTVDNGSGGAVEELPYEIVQPTDETHCDKFVAKNGYKFVASENELVDNTIIVLKFKDGYNPQDYCNYITTSANGINITRFEGMPAGQPASCVEKEDHMPVFGLPLYNALGSIDSGVVCAPINDAMNGIDFTYCIIYFSYCEYSHKIGMLKYL